MKGKKWSIVMLFAMLTAMMFSACKEKTENVKEYDGINISDRQGEIDWDLLAENKNIQFVYLEATEGDSIEDMNYEEYIDEARQSGVKVGSFHEFVNKCPVSAQFENFSSVVIKEKQDLIPMVEVDNKVDKDSLKLFCDMVKEAYGVDPVIFTTNKIFNANCTPEFNGYIKMIGRYGQRTPRIQGDGDYEIWQFSEKGSVPGLKRRVNLNKFHPDFNLSKLLLKQ